MFLYRDHYWLIRVKLGFFSIVLWTIVYLFSYFFWTLYCLSLYGSWLLDDLFGIL